MLAEDRFDTLIAFYSADLGRDPKQVKRQLRRESGLDPWARSPAGACGLAQFMPLTWADLGDPTVNIWNPEEQIRRSCRYMAQLEHTFDALDQALAAYNAGPTRVRQAVTQGGDNWLAHLPLETQAYVAYCLSYDSEQVLGAG